MGYTLNSLTLLALTLSVGIVIDDAIVVMENIFRYIEEKRYTPFEAAVAATSEIALAVMAITLSLVAVFLPIAMMEGIVGRFLGAFGITMSATILISMLVSFTLTPMLAARWFKPVAAEPQGNHTRHGNAREGGSKGQVFYRCIESVYLIALRFSLRHRWLVMAVVIACVAALPYLFQAVPKNFMPDRGLVRFPVERHGSRGHVAGGDADADHTHRPRHPAARRRALHHRQCGRHGSA